VDILDVLDGGTASPREISEILEVGLSHVSYHVRALDKCDCLELVDTAQRRGATEHFYRSKSKVSIGHPAWRNVPRALVGDVTFNAIQQFAGKVVAALEADLIASYDETPIGSVTIMVDEAGEEDARRIVHDLHARLTALDAECRKRARGGAPLKPCVTGHAFIPVAPRPENRGDL
jgi:hypothetical protein